MGLELCDRFEIWQVPQLISYPHMNFITQSPGFVASWDLIVGCHTSVPEVTKNIQCPVSGLKLPRYAAIETIAMLAILDQWPASTETHSTNGIGLFIIGLGHYQWDWI